MYFEFYVLNYDVNLKKVVRFNIFNNINVQQETEKEIKKYLRSPSSYKYEARNNSVYYGFEALCKEINGIIKWQEWGRTEYEISVSDAFITELSDVVASIDDYNTIEELKKDLIEVNNRTPKLEKWDCYMQCEKNIEVITRECIYQYKKQIKNKG